jgi:hypothetical protein
MSPVAGSDACFRSIAATSRIPAFHQLLSSSRRIRS